jgi:hypothetical protein
MIFSIRRCSAATRCFPGIVHSHFGQWRSPLISGIADDKVMYYFVPRMIKCYLEGVDIPNVPTYRQRRRTKNYTRNLETCGQGGQ